MRSGDGSTSLNIGILALQGGIGEHTAMLRKLNLPNLQVKAVRSVIELDGLDGIILPGGESSAQTRLLKHFCMLKPLCQFIKGGMPLTVWILLLNATGMAVSRKDVLMF